MANPTHIKVTAPPGRRTPIHVQDGREPGGGQLCAVDGIVVRVRYSQDVRRAIGRGDLIPCDMNGAACGVDLAAAPDELPDGKIDVRASARANTKPAKVP